MNKLLSGSRFKGQRDFSHGRKPAMGVLLVNLGTPEAPTTSAVRRYLAEFLSDRRVVEIPRLVWSLILHGIILRIRPAKSAAAYKKVWSEQGSPLMAASSELAGQVAQSLESSTSGNCRVELAMRYGLPSIQAGLEKLHLQGAERIMVLPLYPQYSGATSGTVADAVFKSLATWRWVPELRLLGPYHDDHAYVSAVADSIRQHWESKQQTLDNRHKLLISFHGMPKATLEAGDPYFCHCHKSARLIAENLGLEDSQWEMAFQSRFGKAEWLQPYVAKRLEELPVEGIENLTVVCPGFAVDCLETLEEIAMEGKQDFIAAGGKQFDYVPALNARPAHVDFMSGRILKNAAGWPEVDGSVNEFTDLEVLDKSKTMALAIGAN